MSDIQENEWMSRANNWYRRVHFSNVSKVSLGAAYETWILDPERYEGHDALRATLKTLKRSYGKRALAYELVDRLLDEVVAAAGGVEQSITALRNSVSEAQDWADQLTHRPTSGVPHNVGHLSIVKAWYDFANLLAWARALEERLDRRPAKKKLLSGALLPNQGIVNAVKPVRLKNSLDKLLRDLRTGPVGEARLLANFTLHSALIRNPNSGGRLDLTGKVTMPIPDKSTTSVAHWKTLTWRDNRDAITFAEELWKSVDEFMEHLIVAFEKATPKRLRR